jgi:hypothetical protein
MAVWYYGAIGIFVLLLACINFMNLSTARSEKRAKEVGIRKSIGSLRRQLVQQFYGESFMVALIAFVISMAIVQLSLPWFNHVSDKVISIPVMQVNFWLMSLSFVVVTGLLAGSYPARKSFEGRFQIWKGCHGAAKNSRSDSIFSFDCANDRNDHRLSAIAVCQESASGIQSSKSDWHARSFARISGKV